MCDAADTSLARLAGQVIVQADERHGGLFPRRHLALRRPVADGPTAGVQAEVKGQPLRNRSLHTRPALCAGHSRLERCKTGWPRKRRRAGSLCAQPPIPSSPMQRMIRRGGLCWRSLGLWVCERAHDQLHTHDDVKALQNQAFEPVPKRRSFDCKSGVSSYEQRCFKAEVGVSAMGIETKRIF